MDSRLNTSSGSDKYSPRQIKVQASPPKGVKAIDLGDIKGQQIKAQMDQNPEHRGSHSYAPGVDVEGSEVFDSSRIQHTENSDEEELVYASGRDNAKAAIQNLKDVKQIHLVRSKQEALFTQTRKEIDKLDITNLESYATLQTIKQCNEVIQKHNEEWQQLDDSTVQKDRALNDANLKAGIRNVHQVIQNFSKFKGAFTAVFDPIINKNMLNMKLQQLERHKKRQEGVLNDLPGLQESIQSAKNNVLTMEEQFKTLTAKVLQARVQNTKEFIPECENKLALIQNNINKLKTSVTKSLNELSNVSSSNPRHVQNIKDINKSISDAKKRIQDAEKIVATETKKLSTMSDNEYLESTKSALKEDEMVDLTFNDEEAIVKIYDDLKDYQDLYDRLNGINNSTIKAIQAKIDKIQNDILDTVGDIQNGLNEQYIDFIEKIQKLANKIEQGSAVQLARLNKFEEEKIEKPNASISQKELLYLKNEVERYNSSLATTQAQKKIFLDESLALSNGSNDKPVTAEDLEILKENYQSLLQQDARDIPRIKKKIDDLEGYYAKLHQDKIHENHKQSQVIISDLKQQFSDLQQQINALNGKVADVKSSAEQVKNEKFYKDVEMDNESQAKVYGQIEASYQKINKEQGDDDPEKQSLMARKREIMQNLNELVNGFNENNMKIKNAQKGPLSFEMIQEIQAQNERLQEKSKKIMEIVKSGKESAKKIGEDLDAIVTVNIPTIIEKYTEKNKIVDECDERHDRLKAKLEEQNRAFDEKIAALESSMNKMGSIDPKKMARRGSYRNIELEEVEALVKQQEEAEILKERLTKQKEEKEKKGKELEALINKLNEVETREVHQAEIEAILSRIKDLDEELEANDEIGKQCDNDIAEFETQVTELIEETKANKTDESQMKLKNCDETIQELDDAKREIVFRIKQLGELITQAKDLNSKSPEVIAEVFKMEGNLKRYQGELADIDKAYADHTAKRDEQRAIVQKLEAGEDMTPNQVALLLHDLQKVQDALQGTVAQEEAVNTDVNEDIDSISKLLEGQKNKEAIRNQVKEQQNEFDELLGDLSEIMDNYPKSIEQLLMTLNAMLADSEPDKTADYWEERGDIKKAIAVMKDLQERAAGLSKAQKQNKEKAERLAQQLVKTSNTEELKKISDQYEEILEDFESTMNAAYDYRDAFDDTKKSLGDFSIPANIKRRQNEIKQLQNKLHDFEQSLQQLKQADEDFEGDSKSEKEIAALLEQIVDTLAEFAIDIKELDRVQRKQLENYGYKDIHGPTNYDIINEVKNHKDNIAKLRKKTMNIDDTMKQLSKILEAQDQDNALKLIKKKLDKLKERLTDYKKKLDQIAQSGKEMDGNTSNHEEDEFIGALDDEMPVVFQNVDKNFKQLDVLLVKYNQQIKNPDGEMVKQLSKELDGVLVNTNQTEVLVNQLENEIVEWDTPKKLCRRDQEIEAIQVKVNIALKELEKERANMTAELNKCTDKLKAEGGEQNQKNFDTCTTYIEEVKMITQDFKLKQKEVQKLLDGFEKDIPALVYDERDRRRMEDEIIEQQLMQPKAQTAVKGKKQGAIKFDRNVNKPSNMYYCITINSKYKNNIKMLWAEVDQLEALRYELIDMRNELMDQLSKVPENVVKYKAVKGDHIDEMFGEALRAAGCTLPVKRLGPGQYMFGLRKIMAKIINGKLVIRVGGGYMSVAEFIEQYGKIEMQKMQKEQARKGITKGEKGIGIGDVQEALKATIDTVATDLLRVSEKSHQVRQSFSQNDPAMFASLQLSKTASGNHFECVARDGLKRTSDTDGRVDWRGEAAGSRATIKGSGAKSGLGLCTIEETSQRSSNRKSSKRNAKGSLDSESQQSGNSRQFDSRLSQPENTVEEERSSTSSEPEPLRVSQYRPERGSQASNSPPRSPGKAKSLRSSLTEDASGTASLPASAKPPAKVGARKSPQVAIRDEQRAIPANLAVMNKVAAKLAQQSGVTGAINAKIAGAAKASSKANPTLSALTVDDPPRAKKPGLQTPNKTGGLRPPRRDVESGLSPQQQRPAAKTPSKSTKPRK